MSQRFFSIFIHQTIVVKYKSFFSVWHNVFLTKLHCIILRIHFFLDKVTTCSVVFSSCACFWELILLIYLFFSLKNHVAEVEVIFKAHDELEIKYNEEVREKKVGYDKSLFTVCTCTVYANLCKQVKLVCFCVTTALLSHKLRNSNINIVTYAKKLA
jgi:hypothetical protein